MVKNNNVANLFVKWLKSSFERNDQRMVVVRIFLVIIISYLPFSLVAQRGVLDSNPPSVKWNKIVTPNFKIIFPESNVSNGQYIANLMERLHEPAALSLGSPPKKKFSIILQNNSVISNGFVSMQPRRAEFFVTPAQDYNFLGANEWYKLLATHEYRHMVQFQKSETGFTKIFHLMFGRSAQSIWANLAVPDWFWEGDAVGIETTFTPSGRGRIPDFSRLFKTNLMERGGFNYNKQHHGSFKNSIPDHYRLGYFMTTFLRNNHGRDIWSNVTHKAFKWPFIPFVFSNSLKNETGNYLVPTYNALKKDLSDKWSASMADLIPTQSTTINSRGNKVYTDYQFPQQLENGDIVALKSGLSSIPQFVRFDQQGKEHKVFTPGLVSDASMLSIEKDVMAWSEYVFDVRWGAKSYSSIKLYYPNTKKLKVIKKKTRFMTVALSPDASQFVTIEVAEDQRTTMIIFDTRFGTELHRLPNPDNSFYSMPRWSSDGKSVVALKTSQQGKAVIQYSIHEMQETVLIPAGYENIGHPVLYENWLFYNSSYNGIDNIYVLDKLTGLRYQVSNSTYGAYNPEVSHDGSYLYYNDFTKDGFDIVSIPIDDSKWIPIDQVVDREIGYYDQIVEQEHGEDLLDSLPNIKYEVKKHAKLPGFFNAHSWGPEVSTTAESIFAGIETTDILNTVATSVGYSYDVNEETGYGAAAISYQGIFPIFDVRYQFGNRSTFQNIVNQSTGELERTNFRWKESGASFGISVPLLYLRSKYVTNVRIGSAFDYTKVADYNQSIRPLDQVSNGEFQAVEHSVSFSNRLFRAKRNVRSRWYQSVDLNYRYTPLQGDLNGKYLTAETTLGFPGISRNHSFQLRAGYQYRELIFSGGQPNADTYLFPAAVLFPRGYSALTFQQFYHLKADYELPLWYPDISIGPLLYIQRFRANLFADYGYGLTEGIDRDFTSMGVELRADFNAFRYKPLLDVGVRITYVPEFNNYRYELLVANIGF